MLHIKLIEWEAELIAKQEAAVGVSDNKIMCESLLHSTENEIGVKLGQKIFKDWTGWLTYRRSPLSIVLLRGRAFKMGMLGNYRAGLDVNHGVDSITEAERGFDVTPPQELDHVLLNFGSGATTRLFLWYGENIAPYKLVFEADVESCTEEQLQSALVECCSWILNRPKSKTLLEYVKQLGTK